MTFLVLHWWLSNSHRTSNRLHFKSHYDIDEAGTFSRDTIKVAGLNTMPHLCSSAILRLGLATLCLSHLHTSVAADTDCQLGACFQRKCVPRLSEPNGQAYDGVPLVKEATRIYSWLSDWIIEPILSGKPCSCQVVNTKSEVTW